MDADADTVECGAGFPDHRKQEAVTVKVYSKSTELFHIISELFLKEKSLKKNVLYLDSIVFLNCF